MRAKNPHLEDKMSFLCEQELLVMPTWPVALSGISVPNLCKYVLLIAGARQE